MGWMSFLCQKKSKNSPYCAKSSPFGMRFYALFNRQFGNHNTLQNYFAGGALDLLFNFLDNTTWTFRGFVGGAGGGSVWKLPNNSYANFQFMINVGLRFTYAYTRALNGSYKWNKRIKWQKIINGLEVGVRIPTIRSYKTYRDIVVFVNYTWGHAGELCATATKKTSSLTNFLNKFNQIKA
uniref:OMP1525 n=2 Tax=Helicobacter felis TaxID=214 RepID=A0A1M4NGD2_HELFE|nr:OMP1525 [Helicobacter felis]